MARVTEYGTAGGSNPFEDNQNSQSDNTHVIAADQQGPVQVPSDDFIADADIIRDGQDLILEAPDGSTVVIEGYFNADPAPMITAPDGSALTPKMVLNFVHDAGDLQYARADSVVDESPVGHVLEVNGQATVTRADGLSEPLVIGMKVYEGDIIETDGNGAVNIQFIDDSTFAVSENARLAIDEYVFDPQSESGSTNFSVLRGLFVLTSGLIGRDDPDDVQIDTPVGSIGIRGTTIMGNVDTGEITVVEGAIVMRSFDGNEMTLDQQFQTGRFEPASGDIVLVGTLSGSDMAQNYDSMSGVMPSLFSGFTDTGTNDQQQPVSDPALVADAGTTDGATPQDTTQNAPQDGETQLAAVDATAPQQTTTDDATNVSADGTTQVAATDGTTSDDAATADGTVTDGTATTTDGTTQVASAADGTTVQQTADGQTSTAATDGAATDNTTQTTPTDTTDPFVVAGNTGFADATGTSTTSGDGLLSGSTSPTTTTTTISGTSSGSGSTTASTASGTTTATAPPPPPPPLDIDINRLAVDDSLADGQIIATVATTYDFPDVRFVLLDDLGGQIALVDNPTGNKAEIRLVSGPLTAGTPLDIAVRAILPDGRVTSEHFNVNVVDVNTAPVIGNDGAAFSVDENSSNGTLVGTVSASDVDGGQTLSYYITSGAPVGLFLIDSSGNITVNGALDAESVGTYNLTVRVQDNGLGALYDVGSYTVTINDINEAPVMTAPGGNFTIAEDAISGAVVVSASTISGLASDPEGTALTYSITGGNASGAFSIDVNTGEITLNGGILNYESGVHQYSLTVEAFDGSYSAAQIFTIDVTDADDEATALDGTTTNAAAVGTGSSVTLDTTMINASDVDTAKTAITYTLTSALLHGHIEAAGVTSTSFTQAQLEAGQVVYIQDGAPGATETFNFDVGDSINAVSSGAFSISIGDATAPSLETNGTGTEISGLSGLSNLTIDLFMHFDETIKAGTGNIYVREVSGGAIIATIDVTNTSLVSFHGSEVRIVIPAGSDLEYETPYYVEVDNGAITDIAGNAYSGFTGNTTFNFSTGRQTFLTTVGGLGSDGAGATLELRDPSTNKSDGYIMLGEVTSGGQQDIMITKLDNHGFVEDVRILGGTDKETFSGIAHNSDGVFIAGTTNDTSNTNGGDDFMLTNVDLDGNVVWSHVYGTLDNNVSEDIAASTLSSHVFIAGSTQATNEMATVVGIDSTNGSMIWSANLASSGVDVSTYAVLAMNGGKYYEDVIVGGDMAVNNGDMMIARLDDTNGDLAWAYTIDVSGATDELEAMTEMNDGSLVLAGSTTFTDGVGGDGLLVKLSTDVNGNTPSIDWAVSVGDPSSFDTITDVIQLSDNNIAVVGRYGPSSNEAFVAVFNQADGSMVWGSVLGNAAGLTGAASIEETADGMLLISGQTGAVTSGTNDAFALQMTLSGEMEAQGSTSPITAGSLGDGWTLTALSAGVVTTLGVGTDINITSDGTIGSTDAGAGDNVWAGIVMADGDDVNHANDVLGATNGGNEIIGTVNNDTGLLNAMSIQAVVSGFAGNDLIYTDGNDIINGGTGNDTIYLDASGTSGPGTTLFDHDVGYIDGGAGTDIFQLDSQNDLDLSMMGGQDSIGIHNIEEINLADSVNSQTLTLSYDSIIAMTDDNNQLVINSNGANDFVTADLAASGTVSVDAAGGTMGAGYTDYAVTAGGTTVHLFVANAVDQTGITT